MNQLFWNAYKRIEKETLSLTEIIHIDDNQLGVYSSKIADLLVRTVVEIESLSKKMYFENGGSKTDDKDLFFDTDCLMLLEKKWQIGKKTIFISSPYFYLSETSKVLKPLYKSYKRGSSSSHWQQAYQAVKHNRVNNLKKGNFKNLIYALGALYILNIYNRNIDFESVSDKNASNIDWGLGSEIFSVKVSHHDGNTQLMGFHKSSDYDESIYFVKYNEDTYKKYIDATNKVNQDYKEKILSVAVENINRKIRTNQIMIDNSVDLHKLIESEFNADAMLVKQKEIMLEAAKQNGAAIYTALSNLKFEAILNKQQY